MPVRYGSGARLRPDRGREIGGAWVREVAYGWKDLDAPLSGGDGEIGQSAD